MTYYKPIGQKVSQESYLRLEVLSAQDGSKAFNF